MRDRSSNYRTAVERSTQRRQNVTSQFDDHSNRIKDLLRADLIMLQEENALLKAKTKRVGELQEKLDLVLKQNSQLLSENERISKFLHQKKQDYDQLREKLQLQSTQKLTSATEFDYERKKLLAEIDSLETQLKETELLKSNQLSELKAQYQLQLQTSKRQSSTAQDVYEQQIRKLRDQLDKKEYQTSDSLNRLKRFSSEAEYDVLRLKEEKEKLRTELLYLEGEKKKELDVVRAKLEANYLQEIQSIKKNHLSSLEGFELQNKKLKELIDSKTSQIEQLASRSSKQKFSYQQAIISLKKQNDSMRSKMLQYDRSSQNEKDSLKVKLGKLHESQIEEMRVNQQKYIECLQSEVVKLEGTVYKKNADIQKLVKEKAAVRLIFDAQQARLKQEIDSLQARLKDVEGTHADWAFQAEEKLKEKARHIDYLDQLSQDQLQNHQNEISTFKQIVEHAKVELESEKLKSREREQLNLETIDDLNSQNTTLRENLNRERADRDKQIEELSYQLNGTITTLKSKTDSLTSRNNILQRQLVSLKETVVFKEREIKNLQERAKAMEEREKKLERENDELRGKLIKKDQKTNEMLDQQKKRLESTFAFTMDNLKIDHESALKLEGNKQLDLSEKVSRKETQLNDLLRSYKKMREEMEGLSQQQANKKEMTLRFPGATADLIATKNLFDVYLKSRVLQVCADAREKQNKVK